MKPLLFENSIRHLRIPHNTPCLPPKILHNVSFLISPGYYSHSKRNWRQCVYKMFEGQTRCITGDVQMANGTYNSSVCEVQLSSLVWKKRDWYQTDGKVSCFIICHSGKKLKVAFRTWQLHFLHHPRDTYVRKTKLINLLLWDVYVVVQFYPCFKFYFCLFLGMVMYDNDFETKENKI